MSDFVKPAIDDVIISIEPGDHQFPVAPMVANYINQLQRENARLRAAVAKDIAESPK